MESLAPVIRRNCNLNCLKTAGCRSLLFEHDKVEHISGNKYGNFLQEIGSSCLEDVEMGWGFCPIQIEDLIPSFSKVRNMAVGLGTTLAENVLHALPVICPFLESVTPAGSRTPYTIRTPQQGGADTPPGAGPGPPRVSRCGRARRTAWLPLEDSPTYRIQYGRRSKAQSGFCQVALLVACYQGAQCSRWRRPRRVCQSTMPVGHDGSASPIIMPTR